MRCVLCVLILSWCAVLGLCLGGLVFHHRNTPQFVVALALGLSVVPPCSGCINNAARNVLYLFGTFMAHALAALECEGDVDYGDSGPDRPQSFWTPTELPEGELIPRTPLPWRKGQQVIGRARVLFLLCESKCPSF